MDITDIRTQSKPKGQISRYWSTLTGHISSTSIPPVRFRVHVFVDREVVIYMDYTMVSSDTVE